MILASVNPLESRASSLILRYNSYITESIAAALDPSTATVAAQLRALVGTKQDRVGLGGFLAEAAEITADENFGGLPAAMQADVTAIREEVPLAIEHIAMHSAPDAVFATLPDNQKHDATSRAVIDPDVVAIARDVLHFDARANRADGATPTIPTAPIGAKTDDGGASAVGVEPTP